MKTPTGLYVLLTCAWVIGAGGCTSEEADPNRIMPEELVGEWVTDDARYADRSLEIMSEALLFFTDERAFDPYIIHNIQVEPDEDGTRYIIEHSGSEMGRMTLTLFVRTGDSTLVFGNQPQVVWRKLPKEG